MELALSSILGCLHSSVTKSPLLALEKSLARAKTLLPVILSSAAFKVLGELEYSFNKTLRMSLISYTSQISGWDVIVSPFFWYYKYIWASVLAFRYSHKNHNFTHKFFALNYIILLITFRVLITNNQWIFYSSCLSSLLRIVIWHEDDNIELYFIKH